MHLRVAAIVAAVGLAAAPAAPGREPEPRRFYVQLVDALEIRGEDGVVRTRTLQFECCPSARDAGVVMVSDFWVVEYGSEMSAKWVRLRIEDVDATGRVLRGEIKIPPGVGRDAGTWTFSAPATGADHEGTYAGTQGDAVRAGRVEVVFVHDVHERDGRALRAWVPAGPAPVRGLLIWGNRGDGDDRWEVMRDQWLGFCRVHRFALVALSSYLHEMRAGDGRVLNRQLALLAEGCGHPELETAPVIFTGHSNGGMKAWEFNTAYPERVLAFTMSRAAIENQSAAPPAAQANPAMLVIGANDHAGFNRSIYDLFVRGRRASAPWSLVREPRTGHELGDTPDLWLPFFDWAVRARLDRGEAGAERAPRFVGIDPAAGWEAVQRGNKPGENFFGPVGSMHARAVDMSWFPDQTMVWAYVGFVANDPLRIELAPSRHRFRVGERIVLWMRPFTSASWETVQVLVNGELVGTMTSPGAFELHAEKPGVFVVTVLAKPVGSDPVRISRPVSWVIEPQ